MQRIGSVYRVTNLVNGKIYIGQTRKPVNARWTDHISYANTFCGDGIFQRAIRKYGRDAFVVEELAVAADFDALDEAERQLIHDFNSLAPNGYNLDSGGGVGREVHPLTRQKLSVASTAKWTPELRKQASESHRRRYQDPAARAKQSRVQSESERQKRSESMKGKNRGPKSDETKAKISAAKQGRPSGKAKPIQDQNGVTYAGLTDAAEKLGLSISAVSCVLSGKRPHTKGYIFTYVTPGE